MDGKKEYVIKINGVSEGVTDVTKLEDAVNSLDGAIKKVNDTSVSSAKTSSARKAALSEEEKAAQKLADTQKKIEAVNSEANRAQIEATQQLRERTREVTRQIQIEKLAEGSIRRIGMELHDMREAYKEASPAQREYLDSIGEGVEKIRALDAEYKGLKESVGQYQDSVGNYGKALQGLDKLSKGIDGVTKTSQGLAQSLMGGIALMSLFGSESEEDAERTKQLQKVLALLSIAQQVNNNLIKTGISLKTKDTAATQASTAATQASAVATTASSKALGVLKKALIATGIGAIVVLLGTLIANFDKIKKAVTNLIPGLENFGDAWNSIKTVLAGVGQAIVNYVLAPFKAVATFVKHLMDGEIGKAFTEGFAEMKKGIDIVSNYQEGARKQEQKNRENDAKKTAEQNAKSLEDQIKNSEAKYGSDWKYTSEAQSLYKQMFDARRKSYKEDSEEYKESELERLGYERELAERAKDLADERRDAELSAVRAAEDARIKLIEDGNEQARQALNLGYDRQIEDLRKRLETEENLTGAAKAAINDLIISLEQQRDRELEALREEQNAKELEQERARVDALLALRRELEDSDTALIVSAYERRTAEINAQYDRQIEDYEKRQKEIEKQMDSADGKERENLKQQQDTLTRLILNAQTARGAALADLENDQLARQAERQLTAVENALKQVQGKIGEVVVRSKTGLELIDVEATRKNLADTNAALGEYVNGLEDYLKDYQAASDATLATLPTGSAEYEAELQKRARIEEDVAKKIAKAQKQQADNTEASANVQFEAVQELFQKIADIAAGAADAVGMVMGTLNAGLSEQIEALNAQIDAVNEKYEAAQKQREDAAARVEDIEKRLQEASGGTAEALKEQLQDAMHARNEAAREEQRIAKEKERLEAQAAKKDRQMKRNDLISNIAVGVANTAQGVTAALSKGIPGIVMAAVIAAMGAAEVAVMTRQLAKLEHGGEIKGPSHANGGVPIKINGQYAYEAQGGEFMVNDKAYSANKPLVNFINSAQRTITASDLAGIVPSDTTPAGVTDVARLGEDRILDAINGIDFQPVVAVTDIQNVSNEVVAVRDLAGA